MTKYRKKPVEIDAAQWFSKGHCPVWAQYAVTEYDRGFTVKTLEGIMRGDPGDWIIKGVEGEIYPCKPSVFAATYDLVESEDGMPQSTHMSKAGK